MYETKRQNRSLHSRHTRRQGAMMDAGSVAFKQSLEFNHAAQPRHGQLAPANLQAALTRLRSQGCV